MNNLESAHNQPWSLEAEQRVLGALMLDNDAVDRMGDLEDSAFFSEKHRLIYRAIRKQSQWDVITVAEMLEQQGKLGNAGGFDYVGGIVSETPSSANIKRYADIIREHAMRRAIMAAANELNEIVAKRGDVVEAMDKIQSRLMAITEGVKSDEPRSIGAILSDQIDVLEQRLKSDKTGITTGLTDLDAILGGGWRRGQVIVLAGRTSHGKTALSLHSAIEAALHGYGVLYLSMEMVAVELADRALASYGRISLGSILSGRMDEAEWGGISAAVGKLHEIPLHILDRPGLNFYQVANYARRHKRKHGMDVLVVDYLQLMAGAEGEKRHSQIEEITRNMKTLAKELNIAILLLSQLSRKTEEARRPKLSHLRDSGSVEQDADTIIFVHREEVDDPDTQWKNYADIYVAKQRQGALGRIGATYIGEQVRFESYANALPEWDAKPSYNHRGGHQ